MKSQLERIEHIRRSLEAEKQPRADSRYYTIKNWRGKPLNRPVIRVDADYLMYRTENSRTIRQQLAYLRNHPDVSSALFTDPETSRAQSAQQEILVEMINRTGKDFLDDLELRGQEDPAIVTFDGYIVNGNRRTAALKLNGQRYIDCVILPEDTSVKEIYELEQELQMSKDFKEDYHWINELSNIERGIRDKRFGYSEEEMAKRLRMTKQVIQSKLRMKELIDQFLIWRRREGEYDYPNLDEAEEIFRQLEKGVKKYAQNPFMAGELKNAVFNLIEEKPSEGRLYGHVTSLIRDFEDVYSRTRPQLTLQPPAIALVESEDGGVTNESILDELLIDGIDTEQASDWNPVFAESDAAPSVVPMLVEAIEDVRAEKRERKNAEAVYDAVSKALRELQSISIDAETTKVESIVSKLEQIIDISVNLQHQIETIM